MSRSMIIPHPRDHVIIYGMYILKMASHSRERLIKYIQMLQEEETSSRSKGSSDGS
jgi:hypothetical protein